jgi:lipoprotein-releasing system permease protein
MRFSNGSLSWAWRILGFGFREKTSRKRHILSAVLVVMLSVIPLIIAIALVNGMTYGITSKYIYLSSFHARINGADQKQVEQIEDLRAVYPVKEAFSIIYGDSGSVSTMIKAVEPAYLNSSEVSDQLVSREGEEDFFSTADAHEIMLSQEIASEIGAKVGDTVALVAVSYQGGTSRIRPAMYTVSSIVETGYTQLDKQLAFIPHDSSSRLMANTEESTYLGLLFDERVGQSIEQMNQRLLSFDRVTTWDQLNASVYYNFRTSKTILYLIMICIIFIAAVNIAATSILIVQEKHLQIGLLKSIGIPLSTINSSFVLTSALIGLTGSLAGTAAGLIISTQLNRIFGLLQQLEFAALDFYLVDLPVIIPAGEVASVVAAAVIFSVLTSLLPLKRIRTITPIHLLQE